MGGSQFGDFQVFDSELSEVLGLSNASFFYNKRIVYLDFEWFWLR